MKKRIRSDTPLGVWLRLPALMGFIAFSLGIFLSREAPAIVKMHLYCHISPVIITAAILAALCCKRLPVRMGAFCIAGFVLYAYYAATASLLYDGLMEVSRQKRQAVCTGTVVRRPLMIRGSYAFEMTAHSIVNNTVGITANGRKIICFSTQPPPLHGTIACRGTYKPPDIMQNPYTSSEYASVFSNASLGTFFADTIRVLDSAATFITMVNRRVENGIDQAIAHIADTDLRGLARASLLGDQRQLSRGLRDDFKNSGIYHLLALSGFNVVLVTTAVMLFLSLLPLSRTKKIIITLCFIWYYLILTGFIPSLFRATVMATLFLASALVQRNCHPLNALGLAGILWLCISPFSLFQPGFQLSFAATFGILVMMPLFKKIVCLSTLRPIRWFLASFLVTTAAFAFTMPVTLYHFGTISLIGFLTNIVAVGIMSAAMYLMFIGLFLQYISLWCTHAVMYCCGMCFKITALCAHAGSSLTALSWHMPVPCPELFVLYYGVLVGAAAWYEKYRIRYLLASFLALGLFMPMVITLHTRANNRSMDILFFNVKRGAVAGLRFPNNTIFLYGSMQGALFYQVYPEAIAPWLRRQMRQKIDCIILSGVSGNTIRDLIPCFEETVPERVLACPEEGEPSPFQEFIGGYGIAYEALRDSALLFPAPHCTCSVYMAGSKNNRFLNATISLFSFKIFLDMGEWPGREKGREMKQYIAAQKSARTPSSTDNESEGWTIIYKKDTLRRTFCTKSDGPVMVHCTARGIEVPRTMRERIKQSYCVH